MLVSRAVVAMPPDHRSRGLLHYLMHFVRVLPQGWRRISTWRTLPSSSSSSI
jgi:hypothetical protein